MKSIDLDFYNKDENLFNYKTELRTKLSFHSWYRGPNCNYTPEKLTLLDYEAAFKYVLSGWLPEKPMITPEMAITSFGSCFAEHISKWLDRRDFNVLVSKEGTYADSYVVKFGEGMVNTFAIRGQFEWAWEGKTFEEPLWHGKDAKAYNYDDEIRQKTREVFDKTDVFILTLGLSEIWYDEHTGGVFWRAVPQDQFDETRHKFRVAKVEENKNNLQAVYDLIRKHRPNAKVIFTLSPIPLTATFRPVSCMSANTVSKASLRAALDEFMIENEQDGVAYYWPSYDIIREMFADPWRIDRQHIKQPVIDFVMTIFEKYWCTGTNLRLSEQEAWVQAQASAQVHPHGFPEAVAARDLPKLGEMIIQNLTEGQNEDAILILKWLENIATTDPSTREWMDVFLAKLAAAQQN